MAVGRNRAAPYRRPFSELILSPWVLITLAAVIGLFITFQFFHLTPRYVKLAFGLAFGLTVVSLPLPAALAVFLICFPAPTFVFLGDTNVIFIGLLTVVWLVRLRMKTVPPSLPTTLNWALLLYLGAHVVSFLNISDPYILSGSLETMVWMTAAVLLFVLLVNNLRTESHLLWAMRALCFTALFVDITAIAEFYRGIRLVPVWFIYSGATGSKFEEGGRAGGVFGFHGLLADFSAMNFYLQVMMGLRATRWAVKLFYYTMAALALVMISLSANRGGAVIWAVGLVYFSWIYRKGLPWKRVAVLAPFLAGAAALVSTLGKNWFAGERLMLRLVQTQLNRGMPENRVDTWNAFLQKIPEHLWIGHGPFIDIRKGVSMALWPHNAYLFYLYSSGIFGLSMFVWILGKVLWTSRPRGPVDFGKAPLAKAAGAVFHLQVFMFALGQFRDEHQRGNVYIYLMFILFALALVGTRLARSGTPDAVAAGGGREWDRFADMPWLNEETEPATERDAGMGPPEPEGGPS